jgi:hypothetical protein
MWLRVHAWDWGPTGSPKMTPQMKHLGAWHVGKAQLMRRRAAPIAGSTTQGVQGTHEEQLAA